MIYVTADTFHCVVCQIVPGGDGAATTVDWVSSDTDGPHGRCHECGQKFVLAEPYESVPHWTEQKWP